MKSKQLKNYSTMKGIGVFAAVLGGAVIGAACGLLFAPEKGSWLQSRDDLLCGKPEAYIWVTSNPELCDYMQIQIAHRGDVVIRLK